MIKKLILFMAIQNMVLNQCASNQYHEGTICRLCNGYCATCTGPQQYNCESCYAAAIEYVTSPLKDPMHCMNNCIPPQIYDAANLQCYDDCIANCDACTGTTAADCTSCSTGFYTHPTTNQCVSTCPSGSYADTGTGTCINCNAVCGTCSGTQAYNCLTCANGKLELIDSTLKDPKHCVTSCGSGTYTDGANCRVCASNCETCTSGAASDCSLCASGFYAHPTTNECVASCPSGYSPIAATRTCILCDVACGTCTDSANTDCLTCSAQYYEASPNYCAPCNSLCDGCTGPLSTECSTCASGKYAQESTSLTCVNTCSEIGTNYFVDGTVCKACNAACTTCQGSQAYHCDSCEAPAYEFVDSVDKNPKHCVTACNFPRFHDTVNNLCYNCPSNCQECTGTAVADCTLCKTGFYSQPSSPECLSTCPNGYFGNAATSNCDLCDATCTTCVTSSTNCNSCASQHYPTSGGTYPSTCAQCNAACDECTASGNNACQACQPTYYPVELQASSCVNPCTDYAPNYFLDAGVCKECSSECATCSGALNTNCNSCEASHFEIVESPQSSPMHCVSNCPSFYYDDASQCKCKTLSPSACLSNCEICNDAVTCTTCQTGYFKLDAACLNACPTQGYYPNSSSRICQLCSDPNCLDCSQTDKDTCFSCDTNSRYYLQGSTCSYCPAPDAVSATECIVCSQSGYSITSEGTCEQECGDGIRVEATHECDDGNTDDSDGCNSTCHIEPDYSCEGGGPTSRDVCTQIVALNILGTTITPDYKLSVSFNKLVKFEKFKLDSVEIKKSEAIDLTVEFEGGLQEISGYKTSFALEMTPQASVIEEAELEIIISTGAELGPSSPYERIPSQQLRSTITLPPSEVVSSEFEATINSVGNVIQGTSLGLIFGLSISQVAVQSSMESMWVLVNVNQLIALMPLMNIRFPANTIILFKILAFFNGDLIIFKLAYDRSLGKVFTFPDDTPSFNQRFELLGYDSVKLLDNSGVFVVTWVVLSLFVLFAFLLNKACRRSDRINCKRLNSRLVGCVFWGLVLRTLIETFLELGLCSLINLLYISFISPAEAISSIMSLVILLTLLMLPFFVLHILSAPRSKLSKQYYMDKYGQVYKYTYRSESYTRGLFYFLFLMHRYFFVLIVFGARHSGPTQACLMIISTGFYLFYLAYWRPFSNKIDLWLNIANSIMLLVLYIFCFIFSIFASQAYMGRMATLGYVFIVFVFILFFANVVTILTSFIILWVKRCKERRQRKLFPLDQFGNPIETHNNTTSPFQESNNLNNILNMSVDNDRSLMEAAARLNMPQQQNRRELKSFHEEIQEICLSERNPE